MGTRRETGDRRALRVLAPLGLFALAFAIRALPSRSVLLGDRVLPFGQDAFYHLRRIAYSVRRFPEVLDFDRYINFPDGAAPIWTPAFDWTLALALRPFAADDPSAIERLAIWAPPVLGAATVVSLYRLARRHADLPTALAAGVVLSLLPAHFWYSQIGFVDHHAAVALVSTWVLAGGMALLAGGREGAGPWRAGAGAGIAFGLALLVWPGCLLHVGLVEAGLIAALLTRRGRGEAARLARRVALANATALLLVLPQGLASEGARASGFSPLVASGFQPWLFGTLALWSALCAAVWARSGLGSGRGARMASGGVAGAALLGASAALLPGLVEGAADAALWLTRADRFQRLVAESRPLFANDGAFTTRVATARLSYFVLAFPVAFAVALRAARREREPAAFALFLGWAAGLFLAAAAQRRFFNSFAVALALLMAWSLMRVWRSLPAGWLATRARRVAAGAALVGLAFALLLPALRSYRGPASNQLRALRGEPVELAPSAVKALRGVETAEWLRANTPTTAGWLDDRTPEYGVLAPWPLGHVIEYVARRPTVTDNFGDDIGAANFLRARRYFLAAEAEAAALLEALRARYVVAQAAADFLGETPGAGSMLRALYDRDGGEGPAPRERPGAPALARHRLVYESGGVGKSGPPLYKVYEFVAGARLVGAAPAGARVRATLFLRSNRGRELRYAARAVADAAGRYSLRVPYANAGGPPAFTVAPEYTLECGGSVARVRVHERDVRGGGEVRVTGPCGKGERAGVAARATPGLL